jgi:hypothetical protein
MPKGKQRIERSFVKNLLGWEPGKPESLPEKLALERFFKKLEVPDRKTSILRRQAAWRSFIERDEALSVPGNGSLVGPLLPGEFYVARSLIHQWMADLPEPRVIVTNGSEVVPTRGFNSLQQKLERSEWTCTADAFDAWAWLAYSCAALKRAARERYRQTVTCPLDRRDRQRLRWRKFKGRRDAPFLCFRAMLSHITRVVPGSRFSSVRKTNKKDRGIALEPLCNMLLQRSVGDQIRRALRGATGIWLDSLADIHRLRIQDDGLATIDLSSASDRIHLHLVRFLLPKRLFERLLICRSPVIMGPSGLHCLNGFATMGNGSCFDVMSLILTALARVVDPHATCFGDDIIVANAAARRLCELLEQAGLKVNEEKSFIDSEFRESCGAYWLDGYGYITSFECEQPETIHDCIVVHNKVLLLARVYPVFRPLWQKLHRCVPKDHRGPIPPDLASADGASATRYPQVDLSTHFWTDRDCWKQPPLPGVEVNDPRVKEALSRLHIDMGEVRFFHGFVFRPRRASPKRLVVSPRRHFGKLAMYLHASRVEDDTIKGSGTWRSVLFAQVGHRSIRAKALVHTDRRG